MTTAESTVVGETGTWQALRTEDPEFALLLKTCLPRHMQDNALALFSMHVEVAKAHRVTSDPAIGIIRVKWWLDAVAEIYDGASPRKHPIVLSLHQAIATCTLSRGLLDAKIEAHGQDLDGIRTLNWAEASSLFASQRGNLFRLLLQLEDVSDPEVHTAANHLGVAMGVWRSIPEIASINDIPWSAKAPQEPDWIIQALTHLDQAAMVADQPKWMRVLAKYFRIGLLNGASGKTAAAVAHQQAAAFHLWRLGLFK